MEDSSDTNLRLVNYFDNVDKKSNGSLRQTSEADAIWEVASIASSKSQVMENDIQKGKPGENHISMAGSSLNKDLVLAQSNKERILSLIKAWEDNMKKKSQNSYIKKLAKINAWELAEKARAEANLRSIEEKLEKEKAANVEKLKNKVAFVHRVAEEQRALAEAKHGKAIVKTEEIATKCRACGDMPRRFSFCS